MDRPDHVFEGPRRKHPVELLFRAENVVGFDTEFDRARGDGVAVQVEVVDRPFLPERMAPDVQRFGEAVHVLGAAEVVDPGIFRCGDVSLDVRRCEVVRGGGFKVVTSEVNVVVGNQVVRS